jgi:hypothetical protein
MDNTIYEYIKNGITIDGNPTDGYTVFTIPTQHFKMDSLHQLTPETFEREIQKQKEYERISSELISEVFKEVQNEIDQDILNQLRGEKPNPDIVPMDTIDRLYKNFILNPDYKAECVADLMGSQAGQLVKCSNKFEFIDKLLFDDDFYQKWGEDCCEELTYEERYKLWFSNNYETGMEYNPVYTPPTEPDWDNEYYEPTPKRKLK